MIWRLMGTAAASGASVALAKAPVIWSFLGIPYEAPSMVSGLFACFVTRWWIAAAQSARKEHRWMIDVPVSVMVLAVTAGLVVRLNPDIMWSLMLGAGLGMIGEGIFKLAERQVNASGIFTSDGVAIKSAMRKLDKLPPTPGSTNDEKESR